MNYQNNIGFPTTREDNLENVPISNAASIIPYNANTGSNEKVKTIAIIAALIITITIILYVTVFMQSIDNA